MGTTRAREASDQLHDTVNDWRMRRGLSREAAASYLRVSVETWRSWEQRRRNPPEPILLLMRLMDERDRPTLRSWAADQSGTASVPPVPHPDSDTATTGRPGSSK